MHAYLTFDPQNSSNEHCQGCAITAIEVFSLINKKHLKNVGPIRHCKPPHAHSPGVATGTVARRLRIDVHDDNDDNDNDNA